MLPARLSEYLYTTMNSNTSSARQMPARWKKSANGRTTASARLFGGASLNTGSGAMKVVPMPMIINNAMRR